MPKIRAHPPFRLLYDLRWMELGAAGGVEQACYELVSAVGRLDRTNRYLLLAPRSACWEWEFPPGFRVERIPSDPSEGAGARLHAAVARHKAEGADPGFDLVHSTSSYIHPEMIELPGVLTMHDLQHLHFPQFFSDADVENRKTLYRDSLKRARQVICISEFTRRDVHERYGIPLDRLTTIWNIPSSSAWVVPPAEQRCNLLRRMGLEPPFLLYPAQCWPHKNHARAVEAFSIACPHLPRELKLVFTGRPFPHDHPAAMMIRERGLGSRVVHVGFRSPLEIQALLHDCTALFFPSLFEGFGMPVAEAIVAGKPVACSNVTSLPEIAGDAATTFDPTDVDAMAACMVEIAANASLRASLSDAALARRHLFSARSSALKTLAVYQRALAA